MAEIHKPSDAEQRATRKASEHVHDNVEAIAAVYRRIDDTLTRQQRGIENLVAAVSQPRLLFVSVIIVSLWIAGNLGAPGLGLQPLDQPPFFWLQGAVTLCSLVLTVLVLITQSRQGQLTKQRAELDLQVNLLAELKITKIVALLEELRRDSPTIKDRYDGVAAAMERPADPELVALALEVQDDHKR